MAAGIQVPFTELGAEECDSPVWSGDGEVLSVTRKLLVDGWTNAKEARWQLLGHAELVSGVITRTLPQQDWDFPNLYASSVRMQGLAWKGNLHADEVEAETAWGTTNEFKHYVLEVQFTPRPYFLIEDDEVGEIVVDDEDGDPTITTRNEFERFVETETTLEGQYLSIPITGIMKWAEGSAGTVAHPNQVNTPIPANVGKIIAEENYIFRWHQVPDLVLPESAILSCVGKVNKYPFGNPLIYRLYFPTPGTLLMLGAGWRRTYLPKDGAWAWTVEYMMKYKRTKHNNIFNFKDSVPGWYQVSIRGSPAFAGGSIPDGECIYDEGDFRSLFVPETA